MKIALYKSDYKTNWPVRIKLYNWFKSIEKECKTKPPALTHIKNFILMSKRLKQSAFSLVSGSKDYSLIILIKLSSKYIWNQKNNWNQTR